MVATVEQHVHVGPSLAPQMFHQVRQRAIFECCKWDPQFSDISTLCDFPLLLKQEAWLELKRLAEQLTQEVLAAEAELMKRPDLCSMLGLPTEVIAALPHRAGQPGPRGVRCIRFDFHLTSQGWQISEANTDVPGGYIEAGGFVNLMAEHYPGTARLSDPAVALGDAVQQTVGRDARVALIHATAYVDDFQVMNYLARRLRERGLQGILASPDHLRWQAGCPTLETDWYQGPVDYLIRFYPAEWLPQLPARSGWEHWFQNDQPPRSNPATALLTQSKRFPLIWSALDTHLPTWRALLPETRDPREVRWQQEDWVLKPALGRVGENIGLRGLTSAKEWKRLVGEVQRHPGNWIVQRRFEMLPLRCEAGCLYPMFGLFTIGGQAGGIYGRLAHQPLINAQARDVAVLLES